MTEPHPHSHRRTGLNARWLAAGGAVVLAAVVGVALVLQNSGSACAAPPATSAHSGKATFYDLGGGMGNCSFPSAPADDLFVALGPAEYSGAAACGTYLDVTGPRGTVRVKVIDSCPECAAGHLDLSRTAFKKIGAEIDGIIPITYRTVLNPAVPGPLSVRIKNGSSQYWFAALIDNHGNQLSAVKVAGPGGTFRAAHRTNDNQWTIDSGAGSGPFTAKITDQYGRTATLSGITMSPGKTQTTSVRFTGQLSAPIAAPAGHVPAKKKAPAAKPSPASAAPRSAATGGAPAEPSPATTAKAPGTPLDLAGATAAAHCR